MKKRKTKASSSGPWEKTAVQCLLRHRRSGRYYGRFKVKKKQKWIALDTDVFSVAKLRVVDEAAKFQRIRGAVAQVEAGEATMGQLIEIFHERLQADEDLRPSTIRGRETAIKKILKTWPGIKDLQPTQITPVGVQDWATRFKKEGTNFLARGATKIRKGNSASSVNQAIDALRWLLDIAVERGQIHSNPARVKPTYGRLKKKMMQKKLVLPSRSEVEKLLETMEDHTGGRGDEAAHLGRFLRMSGARIGEVPQVTWGKIDWERKVIHLPGYKTETSDRYIPLFPDLEVLLKGIIERRKRIALHRADKNEFLAKTDTVFRIRECQKTINRACATTGIPRITHHDFRHLFATSVIESGVDIPTLSRWLGHNDGGVLAMKTYGHLRTEHSQLSALKVVF